VIAKAVRDLVQARYRQGVALFCFTYSVLGGNKHVLAYFPQSAIGNAWDGLDARDASNAGRWFSRDMAFMSPQHIGLCESKPAQQIMITHKQPVSARRSASLGRLARHHDYCGSWRSRLRSVGKGYQRHGKRLKTRQNTQTKMHPKLSSNLLNTGPEPSRRFSVARMMDRKYFPRQPFE